MWEAKVYKNLNELDEETIACASTPNENESTVYTSNRPTQVRRYNNSMRITRNNTNNPPSNHNYSRIRSAAGDLHMNPDEQLREYKKYSISTPRTNLNQILNNHIPKMKFLGVENNYQVLVMELMGSSLESIFQRENREFDLKTVIMLGCQMIDVLEYIHKKNFIHRDMKPDNFLMGTGNRKKQVFLCDFGLSKKYMSRTTGHIEFRSDKSLTGTARYASLNCHRGYEQSRRDDLEALGYVLLYFLT